jgi:hypothetical protein
MAIIGRLLLRTDHLPGCTRKARHASLHIARASQHFWRVNLPESIPIPINAWPALITHQSDAHPSLGCTST